MVILVSQHIYMTLMMTLMNNKDVNLEHDCLLQQDQHRHLQEDLYNKGLKLQRESHPRNKWHLQQEL